MFLFLINGTANIVYFYYFVSDFCRTKHLASMEADILEIWETDGIFNECEWIGRGIQEHVDLPDFVKTAREAARVVPGCDISFSYDSVCTTSINQFSLPCQL
jgi:hypothetical protein